MDKKQLIAELKSAISSGNLSKTEVLHALSVENTSTETAKDSVIKRMNLSEIFYYIGGIIVLIGLVVLVAQNWNKFAYAMRVFITFGMGLAFFISAVLLSKTDYLRKLGIVFYFISAILIPFGYFVMFIDRINSQNIDFYNTLIPLLCLLQFGITQFVLKNDIFTLFNTIFGTWLFFGLTNNMINNNVSNFGDNFHLYQIMLVGISYVLIGYYLSNKGRLFAGWLNSFGAIGILGSGFVLNVMASSDYNPTASALWIFLYPVMLAAAIISSVYLKNSAFLFVGTICLIGYIIRITAQHFSDTLGWPFALIVMGIAIMGLGYLALHLNKKYIKI